jgi:hypothetical protein
MGRLPVTMFLLAVSIGAGAQAPASPLPGSAALVEEAVEWDGRTVSFTGEAIGEAMRRGSMAWIHLNDDSYGLAGTGTLSGYNSGIGVWIDARLASRISTFGDYRHHGDVVQITGTFHAACAEHGGDLDIHAFSLSLVSAGDETAHPVAPRRLRAAAVMAAVTAALFLARMMLLRRRKVV